MSYYKTNHIVTFSQSNCLRQCWLIALIVCLSLTSKAQALLQGKATNMEGKGIEGANVVLKTQQNTYKLATDSLGYFSQHFAPLDSIRITISHLNFQPLDTALLLSDERMLNITLLPQTQQMEGVTITAHQTISNSNIVIGKNELKVKGRGLGETDVVGLMQQQAGVNHTSEVSPGIYVRGMDYGNTGIYYGGSELFGINHMLSIYPQFNSDAISRVRLIKSDFPPQYGGYLASYLLVDSDSEPQPKWHGSAEVGILTTKLSTGIPITDKLYNKTTFRRSYFDLIANHYNQSKSDKENKLPIYGFYEINNTLNWETEKSGTFTLNAFYSHDNISFKDQQLSFSADWHNALLSCQWQKQLNNNTSVNVNGGYSQFGLSADFSKLLDRIITNRVEQGNATIKISHQFTSDINAETGIDVKVNHINMQSNVNNGTLNDQNSTKWGIPSENLSLFGQIKWALNHSIIFKGGFRSEMFHSDSSFYQLLPYLSVNAKQNKWSAELSYSQQVQHKHLFVPTSINLPLNIWYPATSSLSPEKADHVNVSVSKKIKNNINISLSAFYIHLQNPTEFLDGNYFTSLKFTTEKGRGYSRGLEMMFSIKKEIIEIAGNYTWSKSQRQFASINDGKWFSPSHDIPHKADLNIIWFPHKRWTLTASQFLQSGNVTTLPTSIYLHQKADNSGSMETQIVPVYTSRYNYRMPLMHRLDISAAYSLTVMKCKSAITFGAYNVYNYQNPYFIYFESQQQSDLRNYLQPKKKSLLPFVPFINFKIEF